MKAIIISFVTHVTVIGTLFIASVLAPEQMPRLFTRLTRPVIDAVLLPRDIPLPPLPKARSSSPAAPQTPMAVPANVAPVVAPTGIAPETDHVNLLPGPPAGALVGVTGDTLAIAGSGIVVPLPPPPPPAKEPVRLHSGIVAPRKIVDVPPQYPELARIAHAYGVVIVEATIDEHGNVASARVLRSVNLLDAAAVAAVRRWKFTPARLNGEAIAVIMTVTVNFDLH